LLVSATFGISVDALAAVDVAAALGEPVAGAGTLVEVDGRRVTLGNGEMVARGKELLAST
jgi:hypothetical protein